MEKATATQIFEHYYRDRQRREGAVLPDERLAILDRMEGELLDAGVIPIAVGEVAHFNVDHPTYAAILRGDRVSVGGEPVAAASGGRIPDLGSLPVAARLGLLVPVFLLPVLLVGALLVLRAGDEEATATVPVAMTTATVAATPTPASTATPLSPVVITVTTTPAGPTPTPLPITALRGAVAERGSDPASVEVAGESFVLAVGTTTNGIWLPRGAEWLAGTTVRRVVAIPYRPELVAKLARAEGDIRLRLRNGEVVAYALLGANRVRRDQIEVMAGPVPSIVVIVYGEEGDERLVLTGIARQEGPDAAPVTADTEATPAATIPVGPE